MRGNFLAVALVATAGSGWAQVLPAPDFTGMAAQAYLFSQAAGQARANQYAEEARHQEVRRLQEESSRKLRSAEHTLNVAKDLRDKGHFLQAIQAASSILEEREMAAAFGVRGSAESRIGAYNSAISDLRRAVSLDEFENSAWAELAVCLKVTGEDGEASQILEKLKRRQPATEREKKLFIWMAGVVEGRIQVARPDVATSPPETVFVNQVY